MFEEQTFKSLSQDFLEVVRARVSKTVLKILCKSFSVYLAIEDIAAGIIARRKLGPESLASLLNILSSDLKSGEKSKKATEGHFLQGQLQPQTEIILEQISLKTFFQIGRLSHLL